MLGWGRVSLRRWVSLLRRVLRRRRVLLRRRVVLLLLRICLLRGLLRGIRLLPLCWRVLLRRRWGRHGRSHRNWRSRGRLGAFFGRGRSLGGVHLGALVLQAQVDLARAAAAVVEWEPLVHDLAVQEHADGQAALSDEHAACRRKRAAVRASRGFGRGRQAHLLVKFLSLTSTVSWSSCASTTPNVNFSFHTGVLSAGAYSNDAGR